MTLNPRHCFRLLSVLSCLLLVTACETQNVRPAVPVLSTLPTLPTLPTLEQADESAIVIELDLTEDKTDTSAESLITAEAAPEIQTSVDISTSESDVGSSPSVQQPEVSSTSQADQNVTTVVETAPKITNTLAIEPEGQSIIEIAHLDQPLPPVIDQEVQQIYETPAPVRQWRLLEMAYSLIDQGYAQSSVRLLNQIDLEKLEADLLGRYLEARAETQLLLDDSFGAIVWLHQAQVLAPTTDPQVTSKRLTLKAQAYEANGLTLATAQTLIELSQLENTTDPSQYNERIWSAITQVSAQKLEQNIIRAKSDTSKAWYNLALLPLVHHDLDLQLTALQQWQKQWPNHPAAAKLPGALANLAKLRAHQPKRIALAMPLQGRLGKVGQAVVDGFMAARFAAQEDSSAIASIKVYDTSKIDLDALYSQAAEDQIEMIIGPLDKDKVIELSKRDALAIPTLALNYIPLSTHGSSTANLTQFGLAVEDEASQLAARNLAEGHKRILILHQDQAWAARAAEHFSSSWLELGGEIASQQSFSGAGDHSKAITEALLITESHAREKNIKKILAGSGNSVKFEPRRRQDVDAIVLFALPTDGRQIIPTLAFHYAADLPVYASHHIYQGPTDTSRDRDLEKVTFTELPWLIEQPKIQQEISQKWPARERYTRLFAIGVDAYRLFPRLEQLQKYTDSRVHGVTGLLSLNNQGRIVTQSSWGQFKAGNVIVAPR